MNRTLHFDPITGRFVSRTVSYATEFVPSTHTIPHYGNRNIFDAILFVPICKQHRNVLLKLAKRNCYFFIYFPFKLGISWKNQIAFYLKILLKYIGFWPDPVSNVQQQQQLPQPQLPRPPPPPPQPPPRWDIFRFHQLTLPKYCDTIHQLAILFEVDDRCGGRCKPTAASTTAAAAGGKNATRLANSLKWFAIDRLTANGADLWGPEPYAWLTKPPPAYEDRRAKITELSFDQLRANPRKWSLLLPLEYTDTNVAIVYDDFVRHCYPSSFMNRPIFDDFRSRSAALKTLVISGGAGAGVALSPVQDRLYNAFSDGTYVSIRDFVFNLIALDRRCLHGGIAGELRTRSIFRYYTKYGSPQLDLGDLIQIFADIAATNRKKVKYTPSRMAEAVFRDEKIPKDGGLSLSHFVQLVGRLQIRGTATIYRAESLPIRDFATNRGFTDAGAATFASLLSAAYPELPITAWLDTKSKMPKANIAESRRPYSSYVRARKRICASCTVPQFTLATHSILLSVRNIAVTQELPAPMMTRIPAKIRDRSLRLFQNLPGGSVAGNIVNAYNELRLILRRFSYAKYGFPRSRSSFSTSSPAAMPNNNNPNSSNNNNNHDQQNNNNNPNNHNNNNNNNDLASVIRWERCADRMSLIGKIASLCIDSMTAMKAMPRILRCASPIYIFGDIHGNFRDLMTYDHHFWQFASFGGGLGAGSGTVCRSLFLGDYVDRGENSVECILYLLCMRAMFPQKFFLLRGNHEVRPIQQQFTFFRECIDKFGQYGQDIWNAINAVFDHMPLCAIVDRQIFTAHGGIPGSVLRLEAVQQRIPVPLERPNMCKVAWEILWNDPIASKEYQECLHLYPQNESFPAVPSGFLINIKRGTAFFFSEQAVDRFLEHNALQYVIRAHEVIPAGFQFLMNAKVMTVFSCSNYCGASNESAVILVADGKIRVIKIETNQDYIPN